MATPGLLELDSNLVACVLLHLTPSDLVRVAQTCSELVREADADVVWCTLFLRRFGSDFWGEATPGPHPYTSVPEERNEWLEHSVTDLFARFSVSCHSDDERRTAAGASDGAGDGECGDDDGTEADHANRLMEFVRSHATRDGYGGWKEAYHRMHDMVTAWRKPVTASYIVAGLPAFSTLNTIADTIKMKAHRCFLGKRCSLSENCTRLEADLVSPAGQCRIIRLVLARSDSQDFISNICVVRKPRNWYNADGDEAFFRGIEFNNDYRIPKLVYAVDGERMERSEDYQERVYRELHGMIGEGKGHFAAGLPVALHLLNTNAIETITARLKLPRYTPLNWCPYYAGPVYFRVSAFDTTDEKSSVTAVRRSIQWIAVQPNSRPHWYIDGGLLCALSNS